MLLRIVSTHPPMEVMRITIAGSKAWLSTSPMKCQVKCRRVGVGVPEAQR